MNMRREGSQIHQKRKKKGFWYYTKNILYKILMLIFVAVFAYASFMLYTEWKKKEPSRKSSREYKEKVVTEDKSVKYLEPDWNALKNMNSDIIAWIYVPGCDVNFPVVQRKGDNRYYLNVDASKYVDELGAIFLDGNASSDFTDFNSIIYGHSVIGGGMFTNLKYFKDEAFFEAHPYFYLLTPTQNYRCSIYTFAKTESGSDYYVTNPTIDTLNSMVKASTHSRSLKDIHWKGFSGTEISEKNFITLSTCDLDYGLGSGHRFTLTGLMKKHNKRIKIEE